MVQLVSVPLFLFFWSKERYGEWILLSAIPSYLALADAGFATFSANEVSILVAKGDFNGARRSLHTTFGFLLAVSTSILLLSWLTLWLLPWQHFLRLTLINNREGIFAAALLCLYSISGLFLTLFSAIYRGGFKNARSIYISNAGRLIELCVVAACVALSRSVALLAGFMFATRLLTLMVLHFDSKRFSREIHLGLSAFSMHELRRTWRPATMFMAFSFGNAIYYQGLTLAVGKMLGPASVVVFNTTRAYTRVIVQFVTMIKHSAWPEFSYLFGKGDMPRARRLNALAFEAAWVAALAIAILLCFSANWIIPAWTHHAVHPDNAMVLLFLVSAVLNSLWFICSGVLMGANEHHALAAWYLLTTAGSLVLAVPFISLFGEYGVAWDMILCEFILVPLVLNKTCSLLNESTSAFALDALCLKATRGVVVRWLNP